MKDKITTKEIIAIVGIILAMLGFLIYGYFLIKEDKPKSCWDLYATENEAILHCEVHE